MTISVLAMKRYFCHIYLYPCRKSNFSFPFSHFPVPSHICAVEKFFFWNTVVLHNSFKRCSLALNTPAQGMNKLPQATGILFSSWKIKFIINSTGLENKICRIYVCMYIVSNSFFSHSGFFS
jgi:hypothetical protein